MGHAYDGLGLYPEARPSLPQNHWSSAAQVFGPRSLEAASSMHSLASIAYNQGDFATAIDYDRQALEIYRALLSRGDAKIAAALHSLGDSLGANRDFQQAVPLLREALELARKQKGPTAKPPWKRPSGSA